MKHHCRVPWNPPPHHFVLKHYFVLSTLSSYILHKFWWIWHYWGKNEWINLILHGKHLFLYSDCFRRESNFLATTRPVTAFCVCVLLHCMRVRLRNGYTRTYAQIMQHTHMHKAVTGCVEVKKLLSAGLGLVQRSRQGTTKLIFLRPMPKALNT